MNKLGTIVYVGGFMMPDKNAAAHRVLNNAKILKNIGYEVVFCGVDDSIQCDANDLTPMQSFLSSPSKYPVTNRDWIKSLTDFNHIKNTIEKCDNVQFVIAYNMHALPLIRLIKYCHKHKIKIISDVTEWYENKFSFNPKKFVMCFDTFIVMRSLNYKMDGIITISSYLTKYYGRKKTVQIPPLVDVSDAVWHQSNIETDNGIKFVYAGKKGRGKKEKDQIDLIIDCFSQVQSSVPYSLTILGISEADFLGEYPELASKFNMLSNKILFKGYVSHSESILELLRADYSVFFRECTRKNMAGFPTKFAEAITAGTGVLANNVSDISDYKNDGVCHITEHLDKSEIILNIEHILEGKVKANHQINKTFDYTNYIEKMNLFLHGVLK